MGLTVTVSFVAVGVTVPMPMHVSVPVFMPYHNCVSIIGIAMTCHEIILRTVGHGVIMAVAASHFMRDNMKKHIAK